jgi:hypothetical protein
MDNLAKFPLVVLALSFCTMWLSARIGLFFRKREPNLQEAKREDLDLIVTATLTLLGLIIGFSFSMAISRYDQRNVYEEAEANAIGTEYVRAYLLPAADAARVRALLGDFLEQRILFIEHAMGMNLYRSMPRLLNYRLSYGPPSRLRLPHNRHPFSPWSFQA